MNCTNFYTLAQALSFQERVKASFVPLRQGAFFLGSKTSLLVHQHLAQQYQQGCFSDHYTLPMKPALVFRGLCEDLNHSCYESALAILYRFPFLFSFTMEGQKKEMLFHWLERHSSKDSVLASYFIDVLERLQDEGKADIITKIIGYDYFEDVDEESETDHYLRDDGQTIYLIDGEEIVY